MRPFAREARRVVTPLLALFAVLYVSSAEAQTRAAQAPPSPEQMQQQMAMK